MEISDIRRRLRATIEESRRAAAARRELVADATRDGNRVLRQTTAPLFQTLASALKSEGFQFRVDTPSGAVRLTPVGRSEDFLELALETAVDPPALQLRVSRTRGRRIVLEEKVVAEAPALGQLTETAILDLVMPALTHFLD